MHEILWIIKKNRETKLNIIMITWRIGPWSSYPLGILISMTIGIKIGFCGVISMKGIFWQYMDYLNNIATMTKVIVQSFQVASNLIKFFWDNWLYQSANGFGKETKMVTLCNILSMVVPMIEDRTRSNKMNSLPNYQLVK